MFKTITPSLSNVRQCHLWKNERILHSVVRDPHGSIQFAMNMYIVILY